MAEEQEFVYIRHSGQSDGVPGRVTRDSFDNHWKGRGFVVVDDEEAGLAASPEAQMINEDLVRTSTRKAKG